MNSWSAVTFLSVFKMSKKSFITRSWVHIWLQWTLSISTTLYLELLSISNKKLGPLDICVLSKLFLSLYLEHLYLEQKSWSLATISLSISNFFPSKDPFTQQIEQKCSIFENSNVIKTFEIWKFDCNQNITKCKGFVLN